MRPVRDWSPSGTKPGRASVTANGDLGLEAGPVSGQSDHEFLGGSLPVAQPNLVDRRPLRAFGKVDRKAFAELNGRSEPCCEKVRSLSVGARDSEAGKIGRSGKHLRDVEEMRHERPPLGEPRPAQIAERAVVEERRGARPDRIDVVG